MSPIPDRALGNLPHIEPTILIADDDEGILSVLRDSLGRLAPPCQVKAFRDGEELWSSLQANQGGAAATPALILLDLYMPRLDGHETLEAIRSDPSLTSVPVVMLSSSEAPEDAAAAYRLGANQFAVKPSSIKDYRALVSRLVSRWLS